MPSTPATIAEQIAAAFKKNGGLVTADDLAAYKRGRGRPAVARVARAHAPHPAADGRRADRASGARHARRRSAGRSGTRRTRRRRRPASRPCGSPGTTGSGCSATRSTPTCRSRSCSRREYAKESADRVRAAVKDGKPVAGDVGRPAGRRDDPPERGGRDRADGGADVHARRGVRGAGDGGRAGADRSATGCRGSTRGPGGRTPSARASGRCTTCARRSSPRTASRSWRSGRPAGGGSRTRVFDVLAYRLGEGRPLADAVKAPRVHTEGDLALTLETGVAGGGGRALQGGRVRT